MKKIKIAWLLPVLAIAFFVALQSFHEKQPLSNQLQSTEWFTFASGDETNPALYTYDPDFDPGESGCGGTPYMCAVKAIRNTGNDQPILDLNGTSTAVVTGDNVSQILRHP